MAPPSRYCTGERALSGRLLREFRRSPEFQRPYGKSLTFAGLRFPHSKLIQQCYVQMAAWSCSSTCW